MALSTRAQHLNLGRIGVWSTGIRFGGDAVEAAQELEELGFGTVWIPGGVDDGVLASLDRLLGETARLNWATGIINIWKHEPADLAAWWHKHGKERQQRMLLGLGVSHAPLIGEGWDRPLVRMKEFLDGLEAAGITGERLCLAALGPKMLELSAVIPAASSPSRNSFMRTSGRSQPSPISGA
jgi:probable F420-dependent oxidoreductase